MTFGAKIIAQALHDLGVKVVFGLPGLPVIDIAQEGLYLGIRFISCRNEQAAVYAATAYGYLTGKPGVCICVGAPGVLHTLAGIPHAAANCWPLLVLAGSTETHNAGQDAFQDMDAITLVKPHAKLAARPPYAHMIPKFIKDGYRAAMFGRPGPAFIDLPADLIMGHYEIPRSQLVPISETPISAAPAHKIKQVVEVLKQAKGPLVVVGKGAAYSRAEKQIRRLVESTGIPFVPSPMGKGIVADSSPHNFSAARSTCLKEADVVLLLGARLNWVLSFGLPPKWKAGVKIIQVDIAADELGKNGGDPALGLVGDVGLVVDQISAELGNWRWEGQSSPFYKTIKAAKERNTEKAAKKAANDKVPMTYEHAYKVIREVLDSLTNPAEGEVIYCSEGANAMDISRTCFNSEHPRTRLDAGTFATMGVGLAYAIASWAAYNFSDPEGATGGKGKKKIVAIEGDSAFGFSGMEVETMGRFGMDVLVFVMNNSGLYRGDTEDAKQWKERQDVTLAGGTAKGKGLTAMSLGYETEYHKIGEYAGGKGFVVRTPDELKKATEEGFKAKVPVVVNVIIDQQADLEIDFSWLDMAPPDQKKKTQERQQQSKLRPNTTDASPCSLHELCLSDPRYVGRTAAHRRRKPYPFSRTPPWRASARTPSTRRPRHSSLAAPSSSLPAVSKWFTDVSGRSVLNRAHLAPFGSAVVPLEFSNDSHFTRSEQSLSFFLECAEASSSVYTSRPNRYFSGYIPGARAIKRTKPSNDFFSASPITKPPRKNKKPTARVYLAQASIANLPQGLRDDVPTPDFVLTAGKGDVYDASIWLGEAPTYTPLHRDPNPNLFVQLAGRKIVRLFKPKVGLSIFSKVQEKISGHASASLRGDEMMMGAEKEALEEEVWGGNAHQFRNAAWEAELGPGDGLFIPKGWWHSVKGIGEGMTGSVNWWFR